MVQKVVRTFISRRMMRQAKRQLYKIKCAKDIQRCWRGMLGRRKFAARKQEDAEMIASYKLQLHCGAYFRRKRAMFAKRRRAHEIAAMCLQRAFWRRRAKKKQKQRQILQTLGYCHSCTSRRPEYYLLFTKQALCTKCVEQTMEGIKGRGIGELPSRAGRRLEGGARVEARFRGRSAYWPGYIRRRNPNGTWDVDYDKAVGIADYEKEIDEELIRVLEIPMAARPPIPLALFERQVRCAVSWASLWDLLPIFP